MKCFLNTSCVALLFAAILFSGCTPENHTLSEQSFRLHSDYAITGDFLIRVRLPENYHETDRAYPVFYMTDADWFFGTASDMAYMMELEGKDFILVGIGYGDRTRCREKRMKDLGSDLNENGIPAYTLYQSFLKDELFPEIESRYRALLSNRTYYGWSLGAYFANHLLYEQRDLFDNYILGGGQFPGNWSEHMKNSVRQARNDRPLSLYVGFPGRDAPRESYLNMIRSLKEEDMADLFLQWDIYPDQGHDIESAADVLWKGMRFTYSPKAIEGSLVERYKRAGLDKMLASFEQWKALRPELTDYSPLALISFAKYLDSDDRQKLENYIDKTYPPRTLTFQLSAEELPAAAAVCITGSHPAIGFWDPSAVAMERRSGGQWEKSIEVMSGTQLEYKFTLGSWETEALSADGSTLPNFILSVENDTLIQVAIPGWKTIDN